MNEDTQRSTVYNVGSINLDHVYQVPHFVRPGETLASSELDTVLGGKGANQSVALVRAGVRTRHIGCLGEADGWAADALADAGVDVSRISRVDGASGHAIIQVDAAGENAIVLYGGANQALTDERIDAALVDLKPGDWLVIQNECSGIEHALRVAASSGARIAFNPAPMLESTRALPLELCELLVMNETEAAALGDNTELEVAMQTLGKRLPKTRLVLTRGAQGASMRCGDQRCDVATPTVEVVDTTGAGDTFMGYLVAGLIDELSDSDALEQACRAAALSVTRAGATPSIPTTAELAAW